MMSFDVEDIVDHGLEDLNMCFSGFTKLPLGYCDSLARRVFEYSLDVQFLVVQLPWKEVLGLLMSKFIQLLFAFECS